MGRPRQHDLDGLLDRARRLWIDDGIGGVTIRSLSAATGASNGAIYHAFGSRDGLLASVWSREATHFLGFQRGRVERAAGTGTPLETLVAAALAPSSYAEASPDGARLLLAADVDDLLTDELDDGARSGLVALRTELGELLVDLALALWGRRDRAAVTVVRYCVVDLPAALLLRAEDVTDPLARYALERAVRGIAAEAPPRPSRSLRRVRGRTG